MTGVQTCALPILDGSDKEEVDSAINYIQGSIDDISAKLSEEFQTLWDTIAQAQEIAE